MKYNKIFLILAVAIVLSLLGIAMPATPALAQPLISLSPTSGTIGTTVTVIGTGFTPGATIHIFFGYENRASTIVSPFGVLNTSFDVPTYATPGVAYITVRTGFLPTDFLLAFAYFTVTEVEITLSSSSGYVGEEIKISGTGFAASKNVTIYFDDETAGATETNSVGSFTDATFTVPKSYRGSHTVKAKDESNRSDTDTFTIKQSMTIAPTSGTIGTKVTVSATGFEADEYIIITFDGDEVTTSPASVATNNKGSFSASFHVPASNSGAHEVEASDGTNWDSDDFTIFPTITSLSPTTGYVGDEVRVSGTGFEANGLITITFCNEYSEEKVATGFTNADGSFSISFNVPALAGGSYRVRVSVGTHTEEADFKIGTSASISPTTSVASPGQVGTEVTVSGIGFVAGRTVTVTYDGIQVAITTVKTDGTFSATFETPASSGGEHSMVATDGLTTKQFAFVMESNAPSPPVPLKPEVGIKAEAAPYFDWEEVTDPSGVTYTLQIATSEGFAGGSIVLQKTGLTQSEYTLTEGESLESVSKEAPYYWHVKAIDGASNDSGWSSTGSFYVGFAFAMPQWVIYTLFGIGVLLFFIFGFWLGRKTAYY